MRISRTHSTRLLLCGAVLFELVTTAPVSAAALAPDAVDDLSERLPGSPRHDVISPADPDSREFSATGVRKFRKRQKRPIKLGVSGGNVNDIFFDGDTGYCVSGTLGGLVLKNGSPHILSNNHVLAQQNDASKGDAVGQPGLIDNRCNDDSEDYVANLSAWKKLRFGGVRNNRVDAAIAEIIDGTVDPQGTIQRVGVPGDRVMKPFLGMQVKKAGRTSGLTRGTVVLVDATFVVDFGTEEEPRSAKFIRQIMVSPNGTTFVEPGDSGSVVFYDTKECPEWVGLLFAGSFDGWGVVNPIKRVFRELKKLKPKGVVKPVGCTPSRPLTGEAETGETAAIASAAASIAVSGADSLTVGSSAQKIEAQLRAGRRIVEREDDALLAIGGVVGVGLGITEPDQTQLALHVLVESSLPSVTAAIPDVIDGFPVEVIATGRFRAF